MNDNRIINYFSINRNGGSATSPLIGTYCGTSIPKTIKSFSNKMYLKFKSDVSQHEAGFNIEYDGTATGCGGIVSGNRGSVTSPNYPEHYASNTICAWKIMVNRGSTIQIIFTDVDLEASQSSSCNFDYIEIFDGADISSKSLGRYCSPDNHPLNLESTSNIMFIRMKTDNSENGRGFSIRYISNCNRTLDNNFGIIESPNYPNSYPSGVNCLWTIKAPIGNKVHLDFDDFSLESGPLGVNNSCTYDFVKIKTSDSNTHNLNPEEHYGPYCSVNPGNITSNNNVIEIK